MFSMDFESPFDPDEILKLANFIRVRGAKFSESNALNIDNKIISSVSLVDPKLDKVFFLDFVSQWGSGAKIMVLPQYMKIVQDLNERIIEDSVIEQLLNNK